MTDRISNSATTGNVEPVSTDPINASQRDKYGPVIKSIVPLSTGSAEAHPEHQSGTWLPLWWWVLTSQKWIDIPINFFVIEHRDGLTLFDTGLDPRIATDPHYISHPIGRFLLKRLFRFHICEEDGLDRILHASGFSPNNVKKVVFSHLHFDHVGGIVHIPQAELIVSRQEWNILSGPNPEREWILREHIQLPTANWHPVDFMPSDDPLFTMFEGCYDVVGDGSLILLPTPGHTPGSSSLLVRSSQLPPILLIGDLAYNADMLMEDKVPGMGDANLLHQSYTKVRQLKQMLPELVLVPSHDAVASEALKSILRAQ
ncbi:MAG: N-acyl homoserine lactonase family protein [Hyphomicrobiaceae bacterium]